MVSILSFKLESIASENNASRMIIEADLGGRRGADYIINELESLSYTDGRLVINRKTNQIG